MAGFVHRFVAHDLCSIVSNQGSHEMKASYTPWSTSYRLSSPMRHR